MTRRLTVGPFARVEGDIEVTLDVAAGRVASALAAAAGVQMPPNGRLAANLILACENLADHLTHFYLFFMPDFALPVICGGGWGGVSAAKHLRLLDPSLEVVLLERNPVFFSCPMSNKWLVDVVDAQFLTFSYLDVAQRHGYHFIQTEVSAFARDKKRVVTARGWIDYDYLIVGAGIRYNYEAWFGNDRRAADYTKAMFPSAYIPNAEHFKLKQSIQNFTGGDLVMTLPPPPHRCPPSPYERACLIAGLIKERKIKGKVRKERPAKSHPATPDDAGAEPLRHRNRCRQGYWASSR